MRILINTFTLFCVVALTMTPACSKKQKSPAANKYNQALELQEAERYKDALRLFHKAVQIDPNYEDAYLQIASIYDDHLEDKEQAVEWYQKYLDMSQNENQKKLVNKWLEDAKRSADEIRSGSKGDFAKLSPQIRDLVNKHISLERAKIKKEFKEKEKSFIDKYKKENKNIKEQLASVKSENRELKDRVENLTIDLNASQKNSARNNIRDKLAGLISSASRSRENEKSKNAVSLQKYIDLKTKFEELKVQLKQEQAKNAQLERNISSLNENIRKLKQIKNSADKTTAYQIQIEELQDSNTKLYEKVKLLEAAADKVEKIKNDDLIAEKDLEINTLQNRISKMKDENAKILEEKKQVEQTKSQFQNRIDKLLSNSADTDFAQKAVEENKNLRLQISRITSEFNEISKKQNSAEQKVQELTEKLHKLKNITQVSKPLVPKDSFTDLSDEISTMQNTIRKQKDLITQKDAQILELVTQNINFQKARENTQAETPIKELNALLIQKNKYIQELTEKLNNATANSGTSMIKTEHVQMLSKQIADLRKILSEKEKIINANKNMYQKYKIIYDKLNSKFIDVNNKNNNLESEINALKTQLAAANKAILKFRNLYIQKK
ncbi:MAG: hypothetical protein DRI44_05600 [Chlamydiae bacterium]|nr:MAG: hypothetical protein DRI44_05600 [Chlamydiota bacterium]